MSDKFLYTSILDPLAQPLLDELLFEYDSRYGSFFSAAGAKEEMNKYPPEAFSPPYGNFLLLLRDGQAIGGGAFMRYDDDTAEFKRVWTHSSYRRQGLAKKVLIELERQAARQGYSRIYLTTGFRQPEAVGLYLSNGYTALFDRSVDPETIKSLPFEKWLSVPASAAIESVSSAHNTHSQLSVSR
ncbi:GNAT family N-acetyltransferase [Agrobacterium larrymoorei]|uniref:GNAT family N-acetyltransferase n=1 Tax=Agrobacterium larrymoorei TaxID=160699 RepID=A0AAF0HBR4_9HYPH|nr:GNAT family N-acetyltransferase [Agrobacterium larrymoorei]WHA43561.1 GNAT family N-acetyltransferase [Agrobacterium larrymoorei]